MHSFFQQVIENLLQDSWLTATDFKTVMTPSIDYPQILPGDFESNGALSDDAARVVRKALYAVRFVKCELLWPICFLA